MLNQKQVLSAQPPVVGQVWYSESTGNYFRVDEADSKQVIVTRLAFEFEGQVFRSNKKHGDSHVWPVSAFKVKDLRVVATSLTRFESWLNRTVKADERNGG
jgi:hypothetical protein